MAVGIARFYDPASRRQVTCVMVPSAGWSAGPCGSYAFCAADNSATYVRSRMRFIARPEAVTATCRSTDGFSWLDVEVGLSPQEYRAEVPRGLQRSAAWGLHVADVNIALGDLIDLVAAQGRARV